ncbi:conserved hypothetical protein [uncultured Sporomusa sp.]|uniref:Uncharacterized protein n=1 Tax=uncultured Sporomusa sp. TaxID=307249 RepID=A0A212LQZ2_9FIRM|nr:conserved hypothetical protein [uncultured Sporomusa sp.]
MNWGIEVLQTSALPLGYAAISNNMCESLSSKRSAELPYKYGTGAENEIRTRDPRLGKAMLYR